MTDGRLGAAGSGAGDSRFVGSIPELYDRLMVPMIFAEPALHLSAAVAERAPSEVLETAAGTGVLTAAIRGRLPEVSLTATDLNPPMLAAARSRDGLDGVDWQQADATDLPFPDASFDLVACQFGAMFFPDKVRGFAEARRVLRPGGAFVFNVWDRLETNRVPLLITDALVAAAPEEPLTFMRRTPHGYHAEDELRADLGAAGFDDVEVRLLDTASRTMAAEAALAFCQGTPLRGEIQRHGSLDLAGATALAEEALRAHYGDGPFTEPITWLQVVATTRSG